MKRIFAFVILAGLLLPLIAVADEGMWLYEAFPVGKVKARYNFAPDKEWLERTRLASVRFNNGGSGSFVSADGLAFTNHHVGAECLAQLSTASKDYMKTGFHAKTQAEEAKCPDLELNVLEDIQDVTKDVQAAAKPGMSLAEQAQAQRAAMSTIEQDCAQKTGKRCDIVTLYAGGMYHLYRYRKYTDVRLVFAPEFEAAFFGGDPDNFEYPRFDLDICFFRIYENGKPVHLDNYFKWSAAGTKEGDLVFVSGHPGRTDRLRTMMELKFMRDDRYPTVLQKLKMWNAALKAYSAESPENARQAQEDIFGLENSIKAYAGEYSGLTDAELWRRKEGEEKALRDFVAANAAIKAEVGDPWTALEEAVKVQKEIMVPMSYLERMWGFRTTLTEYARDLVRAAAERQKPNEQRLREYRQSALPSLEQNLFSTAPVYKGLETTWMVTTLTDMAKEMPNDEVVKKILNGRPPADVAKELIGNTKLDDVAVRKQLYEGGQKAIDQSTDPLIVLMRTVEPEARQLRKRYDDQVEAVARAQNTKIARARFAMAGTDLYPDATFTLRLSYGEVKGYVEGNDGPTAPGTKLPAFTTIGGAFEHAAEHKNQEPFNLPDSWYKAKPKLKLETPLNVVSTPDIIGGNSGSPVVNTSREIVGIIFDGNIYSNAWDFMYSDKVGRSLHVDSRGIIEALRKIYDADGLANELLAGAANK
jgi:hypothetical protein